MNKFHHLLIKRNRKSDKYQKWSELIKFIFLYYWKL